MNRPAGTPVPGNRWDLLPDTSGGPAERDGGIPEVSVVVPYYRDQAGLDLLLAALARQDLPASRVQVVIADDGSPESPRLPDRFPLDVQVVRQPDAGFRASAARALGASVAEGQVLAFLDGDMIPERDYLRRAVRLPSRSPEAVVVGRRRHLDPALLQTGWRPGDAVPQDCVLEDPQWLERAYAGSRDLLDADSTSYRFVISAVLTVSRRIHDEAGGFDPSFVGYGGEDWEFAHRLWRTGALLAHEPAAVAWHAGPDFAGREDPLAARRVKNREALVLAGRISAPTARGWSLGSRDRVRLALVLVMPGGGLGACAIDGGSGTVRADGADDGGDGGAAAVVMCADALLQAFPGASLTLAGRVPDGAEVLVRDPRVSVASEVAEPGAGEEPDWLLTVTCPVRPARGTGRPDPAAVQERLLAAERAGRDRIEVTGPAGVVATLVSSRARWRRRRWGTEDPTTTTVADLAGLGWEPTGEAPDLEAWWGGWG
ncbi:MAG: putative glycosyltransferase [Citricoccus sp.]|nr:putative glycosyltransferase [Citricoccus sp. WCRC_4]